MTTYRVKRRDRWTTIDRATVNDVQLSFRARGVLVWLLDKPDGWRCNADLMATAAPEGRDAVRTAIGELVDARYLVRRREQDDRGRWATFTEVNERPVTSSGEHTTATDDGLPGVGESATDDGLPGVGSPTVGKPGAQKQSLISITEEITENTAPSPSALFAEPDSEPTALVVSFDGFWRVYPRRVDKGHARKAYAAATKRATPDRLLEGARQFATSVAGKDPKFIPHAATWLNGDRWLDEPESAVAPLRSEARIDTDRGRPSGDLDPWEGIE